MRILHAIRSDGFAGVEQFVARLARAQAADGHAVRVIGGDPVRMGPLLDPAGVSHIPTADRAPAVMTAVRAHAREADVVNSHMTAADVATACALVGVRHRPAHVSTRHFAQPRGRLGPIPIDALLTPRLDAEISISRAVAAATGRPSTVVHSGVLNVDDARLPRARTILMAQRLEPEKRAALGMQAFAISGLARDGWRLEIAGNGSERPRLTALAEELGIDVRFLGFRADVDALMQSAGMLLAPCTIEGLGLTVIEAMAAGLPVVAANAGGHTEILEGLDRRALYSPEDAEAAARNLVSLAQDDAGRAALGSAGRERQRAAFSLDAQMLATQAVYDAVTARRRGL